MPDEVASSLFDQLTRLCAESTRSVLLAAPFVKAEIVARLISAIRPGVELVVVTRWHASEIAAHVSDLEVWPLLKGRDESLLLLKQDLHAKYYRGDQACLIGSANLTSAALSGHEGGNLELLVSIDAASSELEGFEDRLFSGALRVDDWLYQSFCDLVVALPPVDVVDEPHLAPPPADWYPQFRVPAELYRVYKGAVDYSDDVLSAARADLLALKPPGGLGLSAFEAAIKIALRQTRLLQSLDGFLGANERRFGEVRDWVASWLDRSDGEGTATQTLVRWLLTFLPDRYLYRRPGYSELLSLRVN